MTDLTIGLSVTRTDLSLSALTAAAGNAQVVAYDPGGMSKRRQVQKSPTVAGGAPTSSIPDMRTLALTLRIFGSSKSALDANVAAWCAAFDQFTYTVTLTINGVDTTWACLDADYSLANDGPGVDKYRLMASPLRQLWTFQIPTQPYPTAGVF